MKILVAGVCGFVGSHLARGLQKHIETVEIFGIDSLWRAGSESNRRLNGLRFFHGDLRNSSDLDGLPMVDWVIDAAANPSVLAGVDGKTSPRQIVEHNLLGTVNLLEYCRKASAGFILLSTSRVYSVEQLARLPLKSEAGRFLMRTDAQVPTGVSLEGIDETFSTEAPISLYGATKLSSECLAQEYAACFGFPLWINRCGVLAGAGQFGTAEQGIFSYWLHAWKSRLPLRFIGFSGRGFQVRDAFHPDDLLAAILQELRTPPQASGMILNLGGGVGNALSLSELSDWCRNRWGDHLVTPDFQERPFDIPWTVMDCRKAESKLGWTRRRSIHDILDEIAVHAETCPTWLELASA